MIQKKKLHRTGTQSKNFCDGSNETNTMYTIVLPSFAITPPDGNVDVPTAKNDLHIVLISCPKCQTITNGGSIRSIPFRLNKSLANNFFHLHMVFLIKINVTLIIRTFSII